MLTRFNHWFYTEALGLKLSPKMLTMLRANPDAIRRDAIKRESPFAAKVRESREARARALEPKRLVEVPLKPNHVADRSSSRRLPQKKATAFDRLIPNRKAFIGYLIASILLMVVLNVAQSRDRQRSENEWAARTPEQRAAIIARTRYKNSMAAAANGLGMTFGLMGEDSTTLTAVFDASIDQNVIEGYLTGASRPGYPLDDAVLSQVGFTAVRSGDNFQGVWERTVGDPTVRTLRESTRSAAAPAASRERRINGRAPLFVSKEAMHVGMKMMLQGVTDSDLLAPYISCVASEGDSFVSINGSWTVSEVMITDGRNRGCQGWIPNEYITK
jgi:hypothetical protein